MGAAAVCALTLSHFRSHLSARLAFAAGPVVFFGPNGAGKTNLLEAISLLSPGRGLRQAAPADLARRPEGLGWRISAQIEGPGGRHEIITGAEAPGARRSVRIDDKPASQAALAQVVRMVWLVPRHDRLWQDAASERRAFLDRIVMGFVPDHAEAALAYEKAMRERNRLLRDQIDDAHWLCALESQMASHGAIIRANRRAVLDRLRAAQAGAQTAFPTADLALDETDSPEDLAQALATGRGRDMAAGRSLSGPHRAELIARYAAKGIEARSCSTGEQKALLVSLVLATARALAADTGAPPILLLDELAAHLDADRRAALYAEVCALGAQVFMTGTEAELFEGLAGAQIFEVTEAGDQSCIRAQGQI